MIPPQDSTLDRRLIETEIKHQIAQHDPSANVTLDVFRGNYVAISVERPDGIKDSAEFNDYLARLNIKAKPENIRQYGNTFVYNGNDRFVQIGRA